MQSSGACSGRACSGDRPEDTPWALRGKREAAMAFREPADPLFGILSGHDGGNVAGPLHAPEDCMCHALASALAFPRQRSSGGGCAT